MKEEVEERSPVFDLDEEQEMRNSSRKAARFLEIQMEAMREANLPEQAIENIISSLGERILTPSSPMDSLMEAMAEHAKREAEREDDD